MFLKKTKNLGKSILCKTPTVLNRSKKSGLPDSKTSKKKIAVPEPVEG